MELKAEKPHFMNLGSYCRDLELTPPVELWGKMLKHVNAGVMLSVKPLGWAWQYQGTLYNSEVFESVNEAMFDAAMHLFRFSHGAWRDIPFKPGEDDTRQSVRCLIDSLADGVMAKQEPEPDEPVTGIAGLIRKMQDPAALITRRDMDLATDLLQHVPPHIAVIKGQIKVNPTADSLTIPGVVPDYSGGFSERMAAITSPGEVKRMMDRLQAGERLTPDNLRLILDMLTQYHNLVTKGSTKDHQIFTLRGLLNKANARLQDLANINLGELKHEITMALQENAE